MERYNQFYSGLDIVQNLAPQKFPGRIGLLCHAASVDRKLVHAMYLFEKVFGKRWSAIFSPQHGLVGNVQDNMIESEHFHHPYFQRPVHSLYSETREPTNEMLADIDIVFVDLQDVGTRVYTYIYTLILMMKKCAELGKKVVVLDRPNPVGGEVLEGNLLDKNFSSFVGMLPLPQRHGLTMGEIALMAKNLWGHDCDLEIIQCQQWQRSQHCLHTGYWPLWVNPSPNLPTPDSTLTFVGTVLFEGTNISEGRGSTRSLEVIGHPRIEPYAFLEVINKSIQDKNLQGFVLRPVVYQPMFQKHTGLDCAGFHIHVTDPEKFRPWQLCQLLCYELYHFLGDQFSWKQPPYEYNHHQLPIDLINGTDWVRQWIEKKGAWAELIDLEKKSLHEFEQTRKDFLIY